MKAEEQCMPEIGPVRESVVSLRLSLEVTSVTSGQPADMWQLLDRYGQPGGSSGKPASYREVSTGLFDPFEEASELVQFFCRQQTESIVSAARD